MMALENIAYISYVNPEMLGSSFNELMLVPSLGLYHKVEVSKVNWKFSEQVFVKLFSKVFAK